MHLGNEFLARKKIIMSLFAVLFGNDYVEGGRLFADVSEGYSE